MCTYFNGVVALEAPTAGACVSGGGEGDASILFDHWQRVDIRWEQHKRTSKRRGPNALMFGSVLYFSLE